MSGEDARPMKRARTWLAERSFTVPTTLCPGIRVEVFHRPQAAAMGWYAAVVSSVDAGAKMLQVRYANCSPGKSVEWLNYRNNHDLAFLPSSKADATANVAATAADVPAVSVSLGNRPSESDASTAHLGRAAQMTSSMAANDCPDPAPAAAYEPAASAAAGGATASTSAVTSVPTALVPAAAAPSASASICVEEISLLDSDEEDGVVTTRTIAAPAVSAAVTLIASDSDGSDNDDQEGDDGDVVVKGASASDYPHARCNCTLRRFHTGTFRTPETDMQNATTCKNCYCLVCDVPSSECSRWEDPVERNSPEYSANGAALTIAHTSHCLASDKSEKWVRTRQAGKHDWLKESPLYTHLGAQCYGAGADYFGAGIVAFESFNHPQAVPAEAANRYNSMKRVESALLKSLAHCTALSLQRSPCSSNACKKSDRTLSSSQHEAQKGESDYDYGGYRFKVLPQQQSAGIAIAIADVIATIAVRFTWRPATRILVESATQMETNREAYRRMVGKIDSVWTKALLSKGVSDATRAVARKRLAGLKMKAIEQQAWSSLRAACQAAANGWMHTTGKTEHRRLVAAKIEHLCASRQWADALDYAAKADPSQLPALLVKSGQVFKGVDSLISKSPPRPSYGWPDQNSSMETAEEPAARDRNRVLRGTPEELPEQVKRLQAAPGCDLGAAIALAGLPELKQMPHCTLLLGLCCISATPRLPHLNSGDFTKLYQKMARLAIVSILKGGNDTVPDAGHASDALAGVSKQSLLSSTEQARRRRKGKDSAETVWFEKLATEIVSDGGSLPPIGLGSGCSNRFRELIRTLRRELASDSQGLSSNDSKQQQDKTDDHLQWCGEMAIELVVAACLRALWHPMLCADRGDIQEHLGKRGLGGVLGDSQLRGAAHQLPVATPAAVSSAAPPDTMNSTGHPPTEEDVFWSTLIDLDDGKVEPATSAQRHRQQRTEPAGLSVIPKSSAWSSDPWHTGMSPGQQNTYPRGQFPALMAAPLAALRSLAETAMECGDPRSAVHLLKPLLWTCVDLGAAAVDACCEKAATCGSLAEEAKTELRRCIHFVLCDLLPQVGPAAFSREAMLPPSSCSDLVSGGRAIWPPAPKPHKDDNGNIRVHMPWPIFAKREWRHLVTLRSLGILSSQLLQEAAEMESAPAAHIERWADDHTSSANPSCKAASNPMHAAAARNTEASEQFFATKASVFSATSPHIKRHPAHELAVLRKIVPKSDCVPSSFSTAQPGVSSGGSRLSAVHVQLVEYLGDTCVMLLIDRIKVNPEHNAGAKTGRNERITVELDLARRIVFSYFYTKPGPKPVQLLQALWAAADALGQRPIAMTWEAMQQRLAQQLASYSLPSQHCRVLAPGMKSFLEDYTYCDRLSALACLNAWGPIRDIALAWWRQGDCLGERLLRPIDCGSATLYILVSQAPEELLRSVRSRTAGTERAASRNPSFCKLESVPDPATATTQSVTTPVHTQKKQIYASVALGDAALVSICIHSVVPFCIAVLHAVQLTETMPITSAGVFDGLMRWALRLRPISTGLNLNSLWEKQQCVVMALDEATDRIAESAVSGKVTAGRRETLIRWLRLACGWTVAAAEGRGECAVKAQMIFRDKKLVRFTQTVKKKAPLVRAIKAEFSQPLH